MLAHLDDYLIQFEEAVTAAGGNVHWARDGAEANRTSSRSPGAWRHRAREGQIADDDEIGLNDALEAGGVQAIETDFAELILQLDGDWSSHILVPAIHRNRTEIRDIFRRTIADETITDEPRELAEAARLYLREKFLHARMAVSGANFGVAETGTVCVVESEGNGRMCTTLPPVLVTILGIEKLVPTFADLEVFLQLLPRSATGERMNPYTSLWTGTTRATARRSSTSSCWMRAARVCWPTRSAVRRCTASAAAPASTSALCTRGPAGTPTARSIQGRSARS